MKKTNITIFVFAAFILASLVSCQKADNKNTATNQNTNTTNSNQTGSIPTPTISGTVSTSTGTPTDTYKAAYTARKNKDIEGLKKVLSKDILDFMTMMGKDKKQTLDEVLKELCEQPQAATAEARSEKIDGDKAKIEYLDQGGKWSPMDFVKEDGAWKMTIDKADGPVPSGDKDVKKEDK